MAKTGATSATTKGFGPIEAPPPPSPATPMAVPSQAEGEAWQPENSYDRELVEWLLAPSLRYYAQTLQRRGGQPELPPAGLWPKEMPWLVGVWQGMLTSARSRQRLAAAWWQLEPADRAALGRYLHLASYWQPEAPRAPAPAPRAPAMAARAAATVQPPRKERLSEPAALWAS